MNFGELSSLSFVNLYAGDIPDMPEYRSEQKIGLSLTQNDRWHIRHDVSKPLPFLMTLTIFISPRMSLSTSTTIKFPPYYRKYTESSKREGSSDYRFPIIVAMF